MPFTKAQENTNTKKKFFGITTWYENRYKGRIKYDLSAAFCLVLTFYQSRRVTVTLGYWLNALSGLIETLLENLAIFCSSAPPTAGM